MTESLCCIPEANKILYINYSSNKQINNKRQKKKSQELPHEAQELHLFMVIKEMPIGPFFSVRLTKPMPDIRGSSKKPTRNESMGASLPALTRAPEDARPRRLPHRARGCACCPRLGVLSGHLTLAAAIWQVRGDACPVLPCWVTLVCRDGLYR